MSAPAHKLTARIRAFTLTAQREGTDTYGLQLQEVTGEGQRSALRLRLNASRARRVIESVLAAVRNSGHPKSALGPYRTKLLTLSEAAGVRLALVLLTTAPLVKSRRVDDMARAIAAMTTEEVYYWYAKCVGPDGHRARRGLRLMLAEE